MMTPTVGRVVYFNDRTKNQPKNLAAIISFVHSEERINLAIFDENGVPFSRMRVNRGEQGGEWDWMPNNKNLDQK